MGAKEPTGTGLGLDDLAEPHLKRAMDRVSKLVDHEDPRIAFEASQLIIRLARPGFPGGVAPVSGFGAGRWGGFGGGIGNPWDIWQDRWGGNRAG
jgi:hypothetical protein